MGQGGEGRLFKERGLDGANGPVRIRGRVKKVIFTNPQTFFTVVSLATENGPLVAVGPLGTLKPGEQIVVSGLFRHHAVHGRQLAVSHFEVELPHSLEGVKAYLGSGLIKGIGPALAERITAVFGAQTLDILHDSPERLKEINGIGAKKLASIKRSVRERREMEGLLVFLQAHGLPASLAVRLFGHYGAEALTRIRENPYLLARQVSGIGFIKADHLALKLGLSQDSRQRTTAGLLHPLTVAAEEGHVFLPYKELVSAAARLLDLDQTLIRARAAEMLTAGELVMEDLNEDLDRFQTDQKAIFLPELHRAEKRVAQGVRDILATANLLSRTRTQKIVSQVQERMRPTLTPAQGQAILASVTNKLTIITGGPGTGKTTLTRAIVQVFQVLNLSFSLAAPTGRAAKRLSEATGHPASTIHRLLEYAPASGFQRHAGRRLASQALVVDEASMIDIRLMAQLIQALNRDALLILVGDVDQLPAVGPGLVLGDLIESGRVAVVKLDEVFRQAAASRIISNAHLIRRGQRPDLSQADDFYFIQQEAPQKAADLIVELVTERIPRRFGLDPKRDIQVLAPMRRGSCGVETLNQDLQAALNPSGQRVAGDRFRLGDKVIQVRNNYEKLVFNGDLGFIDQKGAAGGLLVDFEGELKTYESHEMGELALAYCLSVHKAQGSEYQAVVLPLLTEHRIMLRRNLVYTALTRARRLIVLVGGRWILNQAVGDTRGGERRTLLARRLAEGWG